MATMTTMPSTRLMKKRRSTWPEARPGWTRIGRIDENPAEAGRGAAAMETPEQLVRGRVEPTRPPLVQATEHTAATSPTFAKRRSSARTDRYHRAQTGDGRSAVRDLQAVIMTADPTLVLAILMALAFALTNGFLDAANSIATLVATRITRPAPGGRPGRDLQPPGSAPPGRRRGQHRSASW